MFSHAVVLGLALIAGADAGAPRTEKEKVLAFVNDQAAAWNRGDLASFCAVYVEDAVFVSPTGITRGRDEVLARYKRRYPDRASMGTLSFEFLDVRMAGDVVSITAKWTLVYGGKTPPATGHTLIVLHRRGSSWQIVQDASM